MRYESHHEAMDVVASAEQLVVRAQERVSLLQQEMRNYADLEQHAIDAVVNELRFVNGGVDSHSLADDDNEWSRRDRVRRECAMAEAALQRFTTELANANSIAAERNQSLHKAAAFVLAGVVERESQRLAALESQAFQLRQTLRSAASLWLGGIIIG